MLLRMWLTKEVQVLTDLLKYNFENVFTVFVFYVIQSGPAAVWLTTLFELYHFFFFFFNRTK